MKVCHSLHSQVQQLITEQLGRRAPPPSEALFRNQLKFLTVAAGLPEVRLLVAQHFEQWVQNTKVRTIGCGLWWGVVYGGVGSMVGCDLWWGGVYGGVGPMVGCGLWCLWSSGLFLTTRPEASADKSNVTRGDMH